MAPTQPKARSQAEWAAILDRIQGDLTRTLGQTPEPAAASEAVAVRVPLEALDLRVKEIQACLDRAKVCAAETDAQLDSDAETMRLWTNTVKEVREKLAKWGAR